MSSQYFPSYIEPQSDNARVELDLANYATQTDLNNVTHVDTSVFALKTNLTALKTEVDKLDIDKLAAVPTDLDKLKKDVQANFIKKNRI